MFLDFYVLDLIPKADKSYFSFPIKSIVVPVIYEGNHALVSDKVL